jgi:hypothetical protein
MGIGDAAFVAFMSCLTGGIAAYGRERQVASCGAAGDQQRGEAEECGDVKPYLLAMEALAQG